MQVKASDERDPYVDGYNKQNPSEFPFFPSVVEKYWKVRGTAGIRLGGDPEGNASRLAGARRQVALGSQTLVTVHASLHHVAGWIALVLELNGIGQLEVSSGSSGERSHHWRGELWAHGAGSVCPGGVDASG